MVADAALPLPGQTQITKCQLVVYDNYNSRVNLPTFNEFISVDGEKKPAADKEMCSGMGFNSEFHSLNLGELCK